MRHLNRYAPSRIPGEARAGRLTRCEICAAGQAQGLIPIAERVKTSSCRKPGITRNRALLLSPAPDPLDEGVIVVGTQLSSVRNAIPGRTKPPRQLGRHTRPGTDGPHRGPSLTHSDRLGYRTSTVAPSGLSRTFSRKPWRMHLPNSNIKAVPGCRGNQAKHRMRWPPLRVIMSRIGKRRSRGAPEGWPSSSA